MMSQSRKTGIGQSGIGRMGAVLVAAAVLVAFTSFPAVAGESKSEKKKCTSPVEECLAYMAKKMRTSGFVGLELDVDEETGTYTVLAIIAGTPAEEAGIQPGDVLYALNGVRIIKENQEELKKTHTGWKPGQSVTYTIRRDGQDREITLTLAPMPADVMARWIGMHMLEHADEVSAPEE